MIRKIIKIDEEKCNGCGICANACHEGAISIIDGKARLTRDDYCDGMGDCLPTCPTGAISFEVREAAEYDRKAVEENMKKNNIGLHGGCPGSRIHILNTGNDTPDSDITGEIKSQLKNWPVQIKLAPLSAPYFDGAELLVAADCTAFTYADFHRKFMRGKVTLIGCPKLDGIDYSEKLSEIIKNNNIESVTVVRMEVPCCGGIENAVKKALQASGKFIPWRVITVSVDGKISD